MLANPPKSFDYLALLSPPPIARHPNFAQAARKRSWKSTSVNRVKDNIPFRLSLPLTSSSELARARN